MSSPLHVCVCVCEREKEREREREKERERERESVCACVRVCVCVCARAHMRACVLQLLEERLTEAVVVLLHKEAQEVENVRFECSLLDNVAVLKEEIRRAGEETVLEDVGGWVL
jgi:hypothetical protein